jgi:ubiquinone/menaquinone biosynthesis C-methylase UbiE/uncharacterized protein YbaR (Trm112 family)
MYADDINLLCCPVTAEPLELSNSVVDEDGEIISGELRSVPSGNLYPIRNGIPRFVELTSYNSSWDYKWTEIDQGKGLNYKTLDKNDVAYRTHDLFDRNDHNGRAYRHAEGKLALDAGCGVGQCTIKLLLEHGPAKVVSLDLTRGVDMFRKIMLERYPQFRRRILMVQSSIFQMPFRDETFDYAFSMGVMQHTGDTRKALTQVAKALKVGGEINFWIYGAVSVHIDNAETGRKVPMTLGGFVPYFFFYLWAMFQIRMFRKLPHRFAVIVIKMFSSDLWYRLCSLPVVGLLFRGVFATVMHPDRDYRYINNYDGWCNSWAETWTEPEIFPTVRECNIVILGICEWEIGIWGEKKLGFYH